ncbi:MAG: TlpA family protein disulfide reductase [Mucilaginibacter sp.]|nr:TlpA family protein disulfide reductase [Mucilaginibacter sp.]
MGLLLLGFYKPPIPQVKPGEKLPQAPALIVQNTDGKVIDLQQQKGKVVFINFWATWCPPCLAELPSINDFYQKVKDQPNIVFLSVDVDHDLAKSSLFLQKKGYPFPVYAGTLNRLPSQFFSGSIPTTLVIDKKGFVVFNHTSGANYDDDQFAQYVIGLSKQ